MEVGLPTSLLLDLNLFAFVLFMSLGFQQIIL
jgi:hypothetical protein